MHTITKRLLNVAAGYVVWMQTVFPAVADDIIADQSLFSAAAHPFFETGRPS